MKKLLLLILLVFLFACDYNLGPTVNVTNTNTNTNTNTIDLHDLINFAPVPNPTAPVPNPTTGGTDTPLQLPNNAQGIAQGFALANGALLQKECQAIYGETAWQFMDSLISTLKATDPRWGYMVKTNGQISQDVIAYRATADDIGSWGVDVIVDHCGSASFAWQNLGFDPNAKWSGTRF